MHGNGTYTFINGDRYTGGWEDDVIISKGVFSRSNGDRYEDRPSDSDEQETSTIYFTDESNGTTSWIEYTQMDSTFTDEFNSTIISNVNLENSTFDNELNERNITSSEYRLFE